MYKTHSLIRDVPVEQKPLGKILTVPACLRVELRRVIKTLQRHTDQVAVLDRANHVGVFEAALRETPFGAKVFGEHAAEEAEHALGVGDGS